MVSPELVEVELVAPNILAPAGLDPNIPPAVPVEPSTGVPDGLPNNPVVDVVVGAADPGVLKVIELVAGVGWSVTSEALMGDLIPASSSPCGWMLAVCPPSVLVEPSTSVPDGLPNNPDVEGLASPRVKCFISILGQQGK